MLEFVVAYAKRLETPISWHCKATETVARYLISLRDVYLGRLCENVCSLISLVSLFDNISYQEPRDSAGLSQSLGLPELQPNLAEIDLIHVVNLLG